MINQLKTLSPEVYKVAELCSAPICIVNEWLHCREAGKIGVICSSGQIWFSEEAICTCYRKASVQKLLQLNNGTMPKWIKRQHNIKKHFEKKGTTSDYYFTLEMLNADRTVKGSTRGINPDVDESIQLKRFFNQ